MHPPVEGEQGGDIIVIIWVRANSGMRHLFWLLSISECKESWATKTECQQQDHRGVLHRQSADSNYVTSPLQLPQNNWSDSQINQ